MMKLLPFELGKIWGKPSFRMLIAALLSLNIFMLWYRNLPKENEPPLSAYKALASDLKGMNEAQKLEYISGRKERIEDSFVTGNVSGEYLIYTDSLAREWSLLSKVYNEIKRSSEYEEYLASIQKNKEALSGISIFAPADKTSFGSRNAVKSAKDHQRLSGGNVRYVPSKGFAISDGNSITELFMLLSIFLFAGNLITEEKEKGLFYITRSTRRGIGRSIGAKLLALFIHSVAISVLFYGSNLVFAGITTGLSDFGRPLQSVPSFMESSLSISLWEYILLGSLLKAFVLFGFGAGITLVSILTRKSFVPLLYAVGVVGINLLLFLVIPASSKFAPWKYLSMFGLLKPELLLGGYLNFDIANQPVSRLALSVWVVAFLCVAGILLCVLCFCQKKDFTQEKTRITAILPFAPHANLFLHESYKIMVMGKAGLIMALFVILIAGRDLGRTYFPSVSEQYYKAMMSKLEGELTEEKEVLIFVEQNRYNEAFAQIEKINSMVASGEMDEAAGEDGKIKWLSVLSFYPSFQRVLEEYGHIRENGGVFLYDTGYKYLFGKMDNGFLIDFLLISLGIIFSFGNAVAMEYGKESWKLLSATEKGKRAILRNKAACCAICTVFLVLMPWVFRFPAITAEYPLNLWTESVRNIPVYFNLGISVPIWIFAVLMIACQMLAGLFVCAVVLFISWWRKNYLQTTFVSLSLLVIPVVLALMGFGFAK